MRAIAALVWMMGVAAADPSTRPARVTAKLAGATAQIEARVRFTVKRGIHNELAVDLPWGAVITNATARVDVTGSAGRGSAAEWQRGVVDGKAHPFVLDRRERVDEALGALTDHPGANRPWLFAISSDKISIAAPHDGDVILDLEIEAPTCYTADRRYLDLPASWTSATDPTLRRSTRLAETCAKGFQQAVWWPVEAARHAPDGTLASGQRIDVAHGHFAHVELDLAAKLSTVPQDLSTVFVVDASRSIGDRQVRAMQRAIVSYVQHAPTSQLQIVAYSRKARTLLPTWMTARSALPRIERELTNLDLANGSNADAGLAMAASWLRTQHGTRRVVLFDDERIPDRVAGIPVAQLRQLLPENTLVHVVVVNGSTDKATFVRDDEVTFGKLAQLTGGWSGHLLGADGDQPPDFDAEELVRPIALDQVTLTAPGWEEASDAVGTDCRDSPTASHMLEGTTCEWWGKSATGSDHVVVDGLLWNHPVHREVPLVVQPQELARSLVGHEVYLGDAEPEVLAAARSVNSKWSLIATWGGTDGYADEDPIGGMMGGICGCDEGNLGGFGHGTSASVHSSRDVEQQVVAATQACHAGHASLELELTESEIVGVTVTADPADRDCLTEAVWALALIRNDPVPHERVVLKL